MGVITTVAEHILDKDLPPHPLVTGLGHPILDRLAERVYSRALDSVGGPLASWLLQRAPTWTYDPPVPEIENNLDPQSGSSYSGDGWSGEISSWASFGGEEPSSWTNNVRWDVNPSHMSGVFEVTETNSASWVTGFVYRRFYYSRILMVPYMCGNQTAHTMKITRKLVINATNDSQSYKVDYWTFPGTWNFPIPFDGSGPKWIDGSASNHAQEGFPQYQTNPISADCGDPRLILYVEEPMYDVQGVSVTIGGIRWPTFLTTVSDEPELAYKLLLSLPKESFLIGKAIEVPNFHPVFGHVKPPAWAIPYA